MSDQVIRYRVESVASLAMSVIATKAELFALAAAQPVMRVNGAAQDVIQAPKPEPRIMRYELRDYEKWEIRSGDSVMLWQGATVAVFANRLETQSIDDRSPFRHPRPIPISLKTDDLLPRSG
jgi:hypothetical protein